MNATHFKFTRDERVRLVEAVISAWVARGMTTLPPNRDGECKQGKIDFVAAVWAWRTVDSLEYVENKRLDDAAKNREGQS